MTRARSGKTVLRSRKRLRKLTKGFRQSRHNLVRQSTVTLIRSRVYAFRDRRVRKRKFRQLWIIRVNAAARMRGLDLLGSSFVVSCELPPITNSEQRTTNYVRTCLPRTAWLVGAARLCGRGGAAHLEHPVLRQAGSDHAGPQE